MAVIETVKDALRLVIMMDESKGTITKKEAEYALLRMEKYQGLALELFHPAASPITEGQARHLRRLGWKGELPETRGKAWKLASELKADSTLESM